jgi:hypothetical protein
MASRSRPKEVQKIPTLKEFAFRFLDGYAKANRLKPSGIASKETVLRVHLAKAFGHKRLNEITTEDVQRLKAALVERAPKTVNNVLTVLSVVLRTAVEWGVIARVPCSIKLLAVDLRSGHPAHRRRVKAPKGGASFHNFDEFERMVEVARSEALALLVVLLGGEAGLRCGRDHGAGRSERGPRVRDLIVLTRMLLGAHSQLSQQLEIAGAISASFFARVQRLSWRSRFSAASLLACTSEKTNRTGLRRAVNDGPRPSLCRASRVARSLGSPT